MIGIQRFVRTSGFVLAALTSSVAFTSAPPVAFTGGGGEANCTACHNGAAVNSGPATFTLGGSASTAFTGSANLTAAFTSTPSTKHGFQMAVRDSANALVSGWGVNNTTVQKNGSFYVNHTSAGTLGVPSWSATLTPGTLPAGPLTAYAAGNQTNSNNAPSGDLVYTKSFKVYQAGLSAPATWSLGSVAVLSLTAPTRAGHTYFLAMSELPGSTPLGGVFTVPVNLGGALTPLAWDPALSSIFMNFVGTISGLGSATAAVFVPPIPSLAGLNLYFAYATLNPSTFAVTEVSNGISALLQ
jgi:hypothetical protein